MLRFPAIQLTVLALVGLVVLGITNFLIDRRADAAARALIDRVVARQLPGATWTVDSVDGRLSGDVLIRRLEITGSDGGTIRVQDLRLTDVNAARVGRIELRGVHVTDKGTTSTAAQLRLEDVSLDDRGDGPAITAISILTAEALGLREDAGGTAVDIRSARIAGARFETDGVPGRMETLTIEGATARARDGSAGIGRLEMSGLDTARRTGGRPQLAGVTITDLQVQARAGGDLRVERIGGTGRETDGRIATTFEMTGATFATQLLPATAGYRLDAASRTVVTPGERAVEVERFEIRLSHPGKTVSGAIAGGLKATVRPGTPLEMRAVRLETLETLDARLSVEEAGLRTALLEALGPLARNLPARAEAVSLVEHALGLDAGSREALDVFLETGGRLTAQIAYGPGGTNVRLRRPTSP
jgi:hypothetical protein